MRGSSLRGVVLALCAGVFWGLSGTVGQYLFTRKGVYAGVLTVIRMLGADGRSFSCASERCPAYLLRADGTIEPIE